MYDAIVVGARCAGSPLAMLLARKGYKVLLLDRERFPSDHLSTHWIHQPGVACLDRWGLRQQLAATGCPPITAITMDVGPFALRGAPPPSGEVKEAYCPRRTVLDKLLVDAAVASGVELREQFSVDELLRDGDRVTGIAGRSAAGASVTETARVVVGADGIHSLVARAVGAPTYNERPTYSCAYYSYWSGVPVDSVEFYPREHCGLGALPTHDGLTCIIAGLPNQEFPAYRADVEGTYLRILDQVPAFAQRLHAGRREERFRGTGEMLNYFRKPFGQGWALVGDAGYHKDSITAQGITDAFCDAELLADALDATFSRRLAAEQAMGEYEGSRNARALPLYDLTCQFAMLEPPPPEMQQLFAALRGNQADTDRFVGTMAGTFPVAEFFAPDNVARIARHAAHVAGPVG